MDLTPDKEAAKAVWKDAGGQPLAIGQPTVVAGADTVAEPPTALPEAPPLPPLQVPQLAPHHGWTHQELVNKLKGA